jgi:hypothetical protein
MRECALDSADVAQASERELEVTRFAEEQIMAHATSLSEDCLIRCKFGNCLLIPLTALLPGSSRKVFGHFLVRHSLDACREVLRVETIGIAISDGLGLGVRSIRCPN